MIFFNSVAEGSTLFLGRPLIFRFYILYFYLKILIDHLSVFLHFRQTFYQMQNKTTILKDLNFIINFNFAIRFY